MKIKLFSSIQEAENMFTDKRIITFNHQAKKFCMMKYEDGYVVFPDSCPHQGASLSSGFLNNQDEIVCPWHSHRYNLKTGQESNLRSDDLMLHQVYIQQDGIYFENGQ
ncbi:MAG TPA: Rieske 2Fe-2S domain-containing protein [Cyclobacteriaceae bacterium]